MTLPWDVPVEPLPPEAKQWLIDELSRPQYQAAKPTLFDQISKAVADWFASLQFGDAQGPPVVGYTVIIALVVAGLVVAFLIYGLPRLNRRSTVVGELFGENDDRSAADMRAAGAAAASRGDYAMATAELFRAIARGLAERSIVSVTPGTTAHGFAVQATRSFPDFGNRLGDAATAFDEVRYLGHPGSAGAYELLAALESDLRAARPRLDTVSA